MGNLPNNRNNIKMLGGTSTPAAPTAEHNDVATAVREAVEAKHGKGAKFDVTHASTQVVAGTNFFFRVDVGDKVLHLRVFRSLPHAGQEISLVESKEAPAEAELAYF